MPAHTKRPAFARILLSCCALVAAFLPAASEAAPLTPEERRYVETHKSITLCVDPDWVPFEIINEKGEHEGIAADLLRLVAERTGLALTLVPTKDWDQSLAASEQGKCQILSFLNKTPHREEWLIFTEPIFNDSSVFITREEHPFIDDPASLSNETIVFPSGTAMEERVRAQFPNLAVRTTGSENEAMDMVSERKADMTMRSLIIAAYTIKKEGLFNLKIAGRLPDYANTLRVGVIKSEPVLRDILDKGIGTITPQERGQIVNKHVSINVQAAVDHVLIAQISAVFAALAIFGFSWNYKLKKYNAELQRLSHTDLLTDLPNRRKVLAQFESELERARRHGRPFSIIMLDIDHFKNVNDAFGHLVGDKFLISFARVVKESLRGDDLVGRWGGEEFLVLCPGTPPEEARRLAQRIREAVKSHDFETARVHTVSAGVAASDKDENVDSLLQKADNALYQAKNNGRDCVCVL